MNTIHVFKVAVVVAEDCDADSIQVGAAMKYLLENGNVLEVMQIRELELTKQPTEMRG